MGVANIFSLQNTTSFTHSKVVPLSTFAILTLTFCYVSGDLSLLLVKHSKSIDGRLQLRCLFSRVKDVSILSLKNVQVPIFPLLLP